MDQQGIVAFLGAVGAGKVDTGGRAGWVLSSCPLASWTHTGGIDANPSFGVSVVPEGMSKCHCFSCDFSGDLHDVVIEIQQRTRKTGKPGFALNMTKALDLVVKEMDGSVILVDSVDAVVEEHPFPDWWLKGFLPWNAAGDCADYLAGRRVPDRVANEWDLRWDVTRGRVCFPVWDGDGRLRGMHGRAIDEFTGSGTKPKYLVYTHKKRQNPTVFLGEHMVDLNKPVVVTESVFDLLRVYQVYRNVVTPMRAGMSMAQIGRAARMFHMVLMFDGDAAGARATAKLRDNLPDNIFDVVDLREGYAGKDPADLAPLVIAKLLEKLVSLDALLLVQ